MKKIYLLPMLISMPPLSAAVSFSPMDYGAASPSEQDAFDRINDFRADPQNELYEMFAGTLGYTGTQAAFNTLLASNTSHSQDFWVNNFGGDLVTNSMDGAGVVPSTLYNQFAVLSPQSAYSWNDNIGWAAHQYSVWVENDAGASSNSHAVAGAPTLGDRFTNAGVNWGNIGENIAADWVNDPARMHMAFAIDWGFSSSAVDGIQNPPGHRNSMLSDVFTDIGLGIVDMGWTPTRVTQTQHFARVFSTNDEIFYGYVTNMSGGEEAGTTVTVFDAGGTSLGTATTDARGAYTIEFAGGTPSYATYTAATGSVVTSDVALGSSDGNFFLDAQIPEPTSSLLIASGLFLGLMRRRR